MGICIHGHKNATTIVGEKQDYCPVCQQETHMGIVEIRKRKTIFYIPVSKGKVTGHVSVCGTCGKSFNA